MEQALLSGDLPVSDVPGVWNEKYDHYLGITPDNDTLGCLQDMHWSGGLFGYYQSLGFAVEHVQAEDHKSPPLSAEELDAVWQAFQTLDKPVLVHCSAGRDRCTITEPPANRQRR